MRWTRVTAVAMGLLCSAGAVRAQTPTGRIGGVVTESGSSSPLASVSVIVVGTQRGVLTAGDGRYVLAGVPAGAYTVRAMALGYGNEDVQVQVVAGQTATANFQLTPQAVQLNEVVAIGYGSTRKKDLTGAVATVKMDALGESSIATLDQDLAGTAPGVFVNTASSAPGGGISIRIRGTGSFSGNTEPLYVIDGFPIENDIQVAGDAVGNGGRDNTVPFNPLAVLNPADIESISVLKDASATAIYGARGANGVVIITTKTGRSQRPTLTFDMYTGVQSIAKKYDLMDASEFVRYANAFVVAGGQPAPYDTTQSYGVGTNWQDQIFRTAPMRNFQFSAVGSSGGANRTRYAVTGGYFTQDGIVLGSSFNRLTTRLNLDQQVGSRLLLSTSMTASRTRTAQTPTDGAQNANAGAVSAALQYNPTLPVKQPDGTYTLLKNDPISYGPLGAADIDNPVGLTTVDDRLGETRLLGNAFAEYTLLEGLKLKSSFGADYSSRFRNTYYPMATTERGARSNGEARRNTSAVTSWVNENTLTFHRMWGDVHDLTVLGGFTAQRWSSTGENMTNTNFLTDATGYDAIGAGTRTGGPSVGSSAQQWTMESVLGRVNYSLMGRYLFTLTARRDGSSRFGSANRWSTFPSAAVAWRVSDEPFLKKIQAISELKLRTSYGEAGNPSIRPYQSLARMSTINYSFGGTLVGGYFTNGAANPNLKWETTRQFDGGIDLNLFEDRLRFVGDYYSKDTRDLLVTIDLPLEAGLASALKNVGSVTNKGVELAVGYDLFRAETKRGFNWSTELTFAKNRNKVTSLGGVPYLWAPSISNDFKFQGTLVQVGQPIGVFYGFKTTGILRDSTAAANYPVKKYPGTATYQPGDMTYLDRAGAVDANGDTIPDGKITAADQTIIGDPTPKGTFGWQNTFSYKGISLTGLLQGVYGNKILNLNLARAEGSPRANVLRARFEDAWTPQSPTAKYSRIGDDANVIGTSMYTSDMLEDGSYLRLRTITLSVDLPEKLVHAPGLSGARAYISGANLLTITGYSGFNPDVSSLGVGNLNRGVDIGAYPLARTVTFGLSLTY